MLIVNVKSLDPLNIFKMISGSSPDLCIKPCQKRVPFFEVIYLIENMCLGIIYNVYISSISLKGA
jgi:hypothetical protein